MHTLKDACNIAINRKPWQQITLGVYHQP